MVDLARQIGTYPVSIILPDQDCCTLFAPKRPVTKGDLDVARRLEAMPPVSDLVQGTLDRIETRRFGFTPARIGF